MQFLTGLLVFFTSKWISICKIHSLSQNDPRCCLEFLTALKIKIVLREQKYDSKFFSRNFLGNFLEFNFHDIPNYTLDNNFYKNWRQNLHAFHSFDCILASCNYRMLNFHLQSGLRVHPARLKKSCDCFLFHLKN